MPLLQTMMLQPRIGNMKTRPERIGMAGGSRRRRIQAHAHDIRGEEGTIVADDVVPKRVRIWIDTDTHLVNTVPLRGWGRLRLVHGLLSLEREKLEVTRYTCAMYVIGRNSSFRAFDLLI